MSTNIEKLGALIKKQMGKTAERSVPICLELGTINGNLDLVVPSLNNPIPHGDYMLCRQLTIGPYNDFLTVTKIDGTHLVMNPEYPEPVVEVVGRALDHRHEPLIPETMRWIMPGDHVLVAWVGTEAVVIDLVYNSAEYGG